MSLELRRLIICHCRVRFTRGWCIQPCLQSLGPSLPQTCMNQSYLFTPTWRHTGTTLWVASDNSLSISCGNLYGGNRQCMCSMDAALAWTFHSPLKWDLVDSLVSSCSKIMPRHMNSTTTSKYDCDYRSCGISHCDFHPGGYVFALVCLLFDLSDWTITQKVMDECLD